MSQVNYIPGYEGYNYEVYEKEPEGVRETVWGKLYPGQDMDGYGAKITTNKMVNFPFDGRRQYRVYATCFSNVASYWIKKNGKKLFLHT